VLSLLQSGSVEVPVAETFPLDRVGEAYDHFEAGGKLGKVVLELG
jgi:NADPH:quinone reductase-like Zn-dependent oxidoreductase